MYNESEILGENRLMFSMKSCMISISGVQTVRRKEIVCQSEINVLYQIRR